MRYRVRIIDRPMPSLPSANKKYRWRVKDSVNSTWRELPGLYTVDEMLKMRIERFFTAAVPDDSVPGKNASPEG